MTQLVPWRDKTFRFNPGNPSLGVQGKCYNCYLPTPAIHMLVKEDGTPVRALCREHSRVWQAREEIKNWQNVIMAAGRKRPYQRRK